MEIVTKVQDTLTQKESLKEDFQLANREFANATNYLSAGPLCIGTMAQLCLISTNRDFSLNDQEGQKMEFKVLRDPRSFRACLYQVTSEAVDAFKQAHSAMDVVSRETGNVKGYLGQALKILFTGSSIDLEDSFPDVLNRISKVASTCEAEAEAVVKKYECVITVIDELVVAAYSKRNDTEAKKASAEHSKKMAQVKKGQLDERKKEMEQVMKECKEKEKECREELSKRMDEMPSGWDLIGMSIVSGLADTAMNIVTLG